MLVLPPFTLTLTLTLNLNLTLTLTPDSYPHTHPLSYHLIPQSTTVSRFGFIRDLTGSSAIFGENEFSTDVAITMGTAAVADMKRNGIGLGVENSLLAWTDKFVSDYSGNYAPPQWDSGIEGFAPLVPSVFTADASPPVLQKWFMDREGFDFYITFDEPVTVTDGSLIEVFRSASGQRLVAGTGTLMTGATSVPLSGTNTIIVTVPRVCSGGPCRAGQTSQLDALVATDDLLWLAIAEGALQDTSLKASPNVAVVPAAAKAEGEFCSECDDGYYTVKQCTSNQDRVCQSCTVCGVGQYESVACTADQDTRCAICNACPYGTWMSTPCVGANDVVCSPCTVCEGNEFENGACGGTVDTVCASCNTCNIPSKAADLKCSAGQYQYYYNANCCEDVFGETVPCNSASYSDIRAATILGAHHWVFPDTSPPVEGYPFGSEFHADGL